MAEAIDVSRIPLPLQRVRDTAEHRDNGKQLFVPREVDLIEISGLPKLRNF